MWAIHLLNKGSPDKVYFSYIVWNQLFDGQTKQTASQIAVLSQTMHTGKE